MIPQNFSFIASPENRAQHADKVAADRVDAARHSMGTQGIKAAIERKRATNHALMAVQLREARQAPTQERWAAE